MVDTIAAIATPPGFGGVSIVRISGPLCHRLGEEIIGGLPSPRRACLRKFLDEDGRMIDQGIVLYFPSPGSFSGEDVLELHGHGGPVVCDLLLKRCLELGCRIARPGEFSERAFQNGKIDLTQAEAIADLIESATALGARLSARSLTGNFSKQIRMLVDRLTEIRVRVEATLDFPEEDVDSQDSKILERAVGSSVNAIQEILKKAVQGERVRNGLNVVIAGAPNAGKSSLMNLLSQRETAIVTPIPGTTRDPLCVDIQIEGIPIRLTDTAGLRDARDEIEQEGVKRANAKIAQADMILWVYDCTEENVGQPKPTTLGLDGQATVICIRNKIDLQAGDSDCCIEGVEEIAMSAITGEGLEKLHQAITNFSGVGQISEGAFVARRRHVDALERCLLSARRALKAVREGAGLELIAWDLRSAQQSLGEITGDVTSDELLGKIFSSFCIGK